MINKASAMSKQDVALRLVIILGGAGLPVADGEICVPNCFRAEHFMP